MPENNNQSTNKNPTDNKNNDHGLRITTPPVLVKKKSIQSKWMGYVVLALVAVLVISSVLSGGPKDEVSLSDLVNDIRSEKVKKIVVAGDDLRVTYTDDTNKLAKKEPGQSAVGLLADADIDIAKVGLEVDMISVGQILIELAVNLLPLLLISFLLFYFLMRQSGAGGPGGGIMGIGKSKAKLFVKGRQRTTFKDVGGMDEAKKELEEIVDFLKNPKKYIKVGARTPKGVLLVGPAGTGKTLLARAVAGEANVQFLSIAGSEFMEMLVGVGASRVRDLFTTAKKLAPAIIFIDEIDAIGQTRGRGSSGGHDEREQTLNQILVEMDGFNQNDNVIVMAATNRGDMLDPALIRPGRFDRRVMVRLPDLEERRYILSIHAKGKPFDPEVDWSVIAKNTVGFSGADIENMLNEAAIAIARESRKEITMSDIDEAALKVKLGPSKKRLSSNLERTMTAYHEAGHAVVAHASAHADAVSRISIISRGHALGFTMSSPERDKFQTTRSELIDQIAVFLGGRAAEKLIFNEQTAGAGNDIERATRMARAMVVEYGMSKLGAMNLTPLYDDRDYTRFWGDSSKISESLQEKVDNEVKNIMAECTKKAEDILTKYRAELDRVAVKLLDIETIDGQEFTSLMGFSKVKVDEEKILSTLSETKTTKNAQKVRKSVTS